MSFQMKNKKVVLTLSGGCDSSVLLFMAAKQGYEEIHTISFDYGQRHKGELECVSKQIENCKAKYKDVKITNKVIDVRYIRDIAPTSSLTNDNIKTPDIKEAAGEAQPNSYVPFRNMMFVSIACSYAEAMGTNTIMYGTAQADSLAGYWDGSSEWLEYVNSLTSLNRVNKIQVIAPLIEMTKKDIILKGVELGVKFGDTMTCYSGKNPADASSVSSSLRLRGFIDARLIDPVTYIQQDKINELYKLNGCVPIKD
jgi:7-cyano-7-deazaguanine synthase